MGEGGGVGPGALGGPGEALGRGLGGLGGGRGVAGPLIPIGPIDPIGSILYILYYGSSLIYGRGPFFVDLPDTIGKGPKGSSPYCLLSSSGH